MADLHNYNERFNQAAKINGYELPGNANDGILAFIGIDNKSLLDFINSDTFEIKSLNVIDDETDNIDKGNRRLSTIISNIRSLAKTVQSCWQNEEGNDIKSALDRIENISNIFENSVIPTYAKYSEILKELASETRRIQSQTLNN